MAFYRKYVPSSVLRDLYIAFALSCIGDRLWSFTAALLLQHLGGLRLVSISQLIDGVAQMILSTYVGSWMDRNDRKKGVLTALALNNVCVALSAGLLSICFLDHADTYPYLYSLCLLLAMIASSLSSVGSEGEKIAFTKDWIVELTKKEDVNMSTLSTKNAVMKTIDQFSSIISPLFAGVILVNAGQSIACYIFMLFNMISWIVEALLLVKIYNGTQELSTRHRQSLSEKECEGSLLHLKKEETKKGWLNSLAVYYRQSVFFCACGLALLYMTVLGFDGVSISYGKSQGVKEDILGIFRSLGSTIGVSGAVIYSLLEKKLGVRKTGLIGYIAQQLALSLCLLSIWLPGSPFDPSGYKNHFEAKKWWIELRTSLTEPTPSRATPIHENSSEIIERNKAVWNSPKISIYSFLVGIAAARLGLWMVDLSITQLMQQQVSLQERNTVFGVQNAINKFFYVLKDIIVIMLPSPETFGFLIIISTVFIFSGFLCYLIYLHKNRNITKSSGLDNVDHGNEKELVLLTVRPTRTVRDPNS